MYRSIDRKNGRDKIISEHRNYNGSTLICIEKHRATFKCSCGLTFSLTKETVIKFIKNKHNKYYSYNMDNFGCSCKRKLPVSNYFSEAFLTTFRCRKLDFDIDIYYLDSLYETQDRKCFYTGELLILPDKNNFRPGKHYNVSIDRLDSNIGYLKGNCVLCCKKANMFKFTIKYDRFWEICKQISDFN